MPISKIISGGQTGVDRAALDAAIDCRIPVGGWCPAGRKAEDGPIPAKYELQETDSARYEVRTKRNVRESDGTLIITIGSPTGGTSLTVRTAQRLPKPFLLVDLASSESDDQIRSILTWMKENDLQTLNVAGPRESTCPGIEEQAKTLLRAVFKSGQQKTLP